MLHYIYHCFGFIWIISYIVSFGYFIIGSVVCIWYFSLNTEEEGKISSIKESIYRAFRYHCGSLAFGSFIKTFFDPLSFTL